MEDDLKILKIEYLSNHWLDLVQIRLMKTTSNGRRHQNTKRGISQQPLIGSYSNTMEDDLR